MYLHTVRVELSLLHDTILRVDIVATNVAWEIKLQWYFVLFCFFMENSSWNTAVRQNTSFHVRVSTVTKATRIAAENSDTYDTNQTLYLFCDIPTLITQHLVSLFSNVTQSKCVVFSVNSHRQGAGLFSWQAFQLAEIMSANCDLFHILNKHGNKYLCQCSMLRFFSTAI